MSPHSDLRAPIGLLAAMALAALMACDKDTSKSTTGAAPTDQAAAEQKEAAMNDEPTPAPGAPAAAARTPNDPGDGQIPAEYRKLKQAGCDLSKYVIATPIEARVLRNTPYALAGRPFDAPELSQLFASDGTWYKPGAASDVQLAPEDEACVKTLTEHENQLRARIKVDQDIEAKLTNLAVFLGLRKYSRPGLELQHGHAQKTEFEWQWTLLVSHCKKGEECEGVTLVCSQYGDDDMTCEVHPIG